MSTENIIDINKAVEMQRLILSENPSTEARLVLQYLEAEKQAADVVKAWVNQDGSTMIREQAL